LRARIVVFVAIVQFILFLAHWFIYSTWVTFRDQAASPELQIAVALLSISFVTASLLAFRTYNVLARILYKLAAVWLGMVNFLFLAACACWVMLAATLLLGVNVNRAMVATVLFGSAILASAYGVVNARWVREVKVTVKLPNLPPSWRGRMAALVSDVHLGHINGTAFLRRIVARLARLQPDIVFITGDLYDGSKVNAPEMAAAWKDCSPPWGAYFVTGNHEEFADSSRYLEAVRHSGVRVLSNEKATIEGLQVVGINHHDTTSTDRFGAALSHAQIDRNQTSILLSHSPHGLAIPEAAGISLQLSGHTHGGQMPPFTWFTRRIFGPYTHGLQRFGEMQVYTTFGVGTWGPPMRIGTQPEIILIEFA
jgi:predicted MPP superfamily phosphohydrolase